MKTNGRNRTANETIRRSGYVTDNLARAYAEPAYRPQHENNPERKRKAAQQSAPVIGIRKRMGFLACTIMLAGLIAVLYNGIGYLNTLARTHSLDRELTALTNDYANLYRTNDESEQAIAASVDINHVYEVAVGQYGMVYPRDNEVIALTQRGDGYVRQYSPVAEEEKPEESVFEQILSKLMR
ncbi:MAG: hypothetical protein J5532_04535 [Lachnospiraceae bacterium]|nr:hypothetical protein [Lachnospiraceae bacterium]